MKRKINLQFIIVALVAILTTVSLSAFVFYEQFKKEVASELKNYADLIVETDAWSINTKPSIGSAPLESEHRSQIRITLVEEDGTAIFDTNAEIGSMENHGERPEIQQALTTGEGEAIRKSATLNKSAFYYALKLDNGCVLRVSKETSSISSIFVNVLPIIIGLCVVLFILGIFMSHLLTRSIIDPIENLADHLDESDSLQIYKEMEPFVATIRRQHADIMRNANMRQEFTANVSHELKTPLTSISGYSELIESGMATNQDIQRFAGEIHKNSNRLLTLINDIIRLSQLDQVTSEVVYEQVNIYDIACNCADMLQMSAQKHNVTIEVTGEKQLVIANRQMMDELIYNLCDNAIRYNNPGGRVDVQVNRIGSDVVVQVKDTGIGISKGNQDRIFERFYRVDKSRSKSTGGTGLGLAIVKHIVARHNNARLELESEEGVGTTITVTFDTTAQL